MMDWIYIERKYQQLKADYDRTWNNWGQLSHGRTL
jgi:hypothetical protein